MSPDSVCTAFVVDCWSQVVYHAGVASCGDLTMTTLNLNDEAYIFNIFFSSYSLSIKHIQIQAQHGSRSSNSLSPHSTFSSCVSSMLCVVQVKAQHGSRSPESELSTDEKRQILADILVWAEITQEHYDQNMLM